MYAIAIDGELKASKLAPVEITKLVQAELREGQERKIEIASFNGRQWIPICVDRFAGGLLRAA